MRRATILLALLLTSAGTSGPAARASLAGGAEQAIASITTRELRAHVTFLASDELEGRAVGTPGNAIAAEYLAAALARAGIAGAGDAGYFERFDLVTSTLGTRSALTLTDSRGRPVQEYRVGEHFSPLRASAARDASGPLVVAGYGVTDAARRYDDYAGIDPSGRIVVVLAEARSETANARVGRLDGRGPSIGLRVREAARRGAVGMIVVGGRDGRSLDRLWREGATPNNRHYFLAADLLPIPVARLSEEAGAILLGAGNRQPVSVSDLRARIDEAINRAGKAGEVHGAGSWAIPGWRAILTVDIDHARTPSRNVLGRLDGRDPALRNEAVIVSAHLDHDGVDQNGRVYNGADDDGSGTAGVLEIADALSVAAASGARPRRSIIVAFWNAEERGLLGSRYHTSGERPGATPVTVLNLDMIGRDEEIPPGGDARFFGLPPRDARESLNRLHLLGYTYSPGLAAIVAEENAAVGLDVRRELDRSGSNLLRRSDHWPFLERGVPALFLTTGLHPDYHTPYDDVRKIRFDKMERIVRLAYRVAWRVADADRPPRFVAPRGEQHSAP